MLNDYTKIAKQLEKHKTVQGIMQYINEESIIKQHEKQIKGKATGIDRMTKEEYEENKEENAKDLIERMKKFKYRPKPVRRTYIPKEGNQKGRPLGIPSYEDKLVQGAMAEVLNEIYEKKFLNCSYGFRANRNCHEAMKELDRIIETQRVNYIVDADIKGFFENIDHKWLVKFLEETIQDKNFIRYITRFLKCGIMEEGRRIEQDKGTPQGGLISPILANVYLHYVLDMWIEKDIKKRYAGEVHVIRYADDFVVCIEYEKEAKKFYEELKERLKKFNLEVEENKTKIIKFGKSNNGSKEQFDFLGITYINGKNKAGKYKVIHRTSKKKMKMKKRVAKQWIKENRNKPIKEIIGKLNIKLQGHYRYYGIRDNYRKLEEFKRYIIITLYKQLRKRGQKKRLTWEQYNKILRYNPIVQPKIYVS